MRKLKIIAWMGFMLMAAFSGSAYSSAASADGQTKVLNVDLVAEPVQYIFINGDAEKFQALHWKKENYAGGIKTFSAEGVLPGDIKMTADGHALLDENDLAANGSLKKAGWGYLNFRYGEFRKYYDGSGGTYNRFTVLRVSELQKELALDIGELAVELGVTARNFPELVLLYERRFKDGAKSRLNWGAAKQGSTTRNITPTWQDIDETVDTFSIRASRIVKGFNLHGEQSWEVVGGELMREEKDLATTGVAADTHIRRQTHNPRSLLIATVLGLDRWLAKERVYLASNYRVARLDSREFENEREFTQFGVPAGTHNTINAEGENNYDTHTWTGSLMAYPWDSFSVSSKVKAEVIRHDSDSTYPQDSTDPPDLAANTITLSHADTRGVRWGEGFSIRYSGIPRTALYSELELEESRIDLREDRISLAGQSGSSANDIFSRNTVTNVWRGVGTVGGHFAPWSFLDVTTQVRHRERVNDYDDQSETVPGSTTAKSAFFDGQRIRTEEFSIRTTLKAWRIFKPSFRYQFQDTTYSNRIEAQSTVDSDMYSHIYTFDIFSQPWADLLITTTFSRQTAATETPARFLGSTSRIPAFNANVSTMLVSTDYSINERVSWTSSVLYSRADNFDDFSSYGLPLGVDDRRVEVATGLRWTVRKDVTLQPQYAFYDYKANPNSESGDYHAHLISVDVTVLWG